MGSSGEHDIPALRRRASGWDASGCPPPGWIDGVPGLWRWLSVWLGGRAPYRRFRRLTRADQRLLLGAKDAWDLLVRLDDSGLDMDWWRSVALVRAAGATIHEVDGVADWKGCVAALFWDVGLPLLMWRRPYGVDEMGRLVHVPRPRRVMHERALFGQDHETLGARGMVAWGLQDLLPSGHSEATRTVVSSQAVALADLFQTLGHPEACLALGAPSARWVGALVEAQACVHLARTWSAALLVPFVGVDAILAQLTQVPSNGPHRR